MSTTSLTGAAGIAPRRDPVDPVAIGVRTLVIAALLVLSVVALAFFLQSVFNALLVCLLAIVFAEAIRPLVVSLNRRRVPMPVGILAVYLLLIGGFVGLVALLAGPTTTDAANLVRKLPSYQKEALDLIRSVSTRLGVHIDVSQQVGSALGVVQSALVSVGSTFVAVVANLAVIVVIAFLWLVSSANLKRFTLDLLPSRHQALAAVVLDEIGNRAGGYLRGATINGLIVGVTTGALAALLGLPSPILIGAFTGVVALIPVVGAVLGVAVPSLLALSLGPTHLMIVLIVMTVLQVVDANTVVPIVLNRETALPTLAVVIALLIGGVVAGVIGAVLAVPVASAVEVLVVRVLVPALHRIEGRTGSEASAQLQG